MSNFSTYGGVSTSKHQKHSEITGHLIIRLFNITLINYAIRSLHVCLLHVGIVRVHVHAWVRRFESPLDPRTDWPGCYIHVRRCGGLSMVNLKLQDPLELFVKKRKFLHGCSFLSRRDMTVICWKRRKTHFYHFVQCIADNKLRCYH